MYVEEGDLPSEWVDKLGVLRPLSLPSEVQRGRVWETTKGIGARSSVMVSILIQLEYKAMIKVFTPVI